MDSYYKLRQVFHYKVRHGLLQIATGITKCDGFITNCDSTGVFTLLMHFLSHQFSRSLQITTLLLSVEKNNVNRFNPRSDQCQNSTRSFSKTLKKQIAPCKSTAKGIYLNGHTKRFRQETQKLVRDLAQN